LFLLWNFYYQLRLSTFQECLPSTFQDSVKKEEDMKKELQVRLAIAEFLRDTLAAVAKKKTKDIDAKSGAEIEQFIERCRRGEPMSNSEIIEYTKYFHDELTLENMERPQLVNMCKYMGLKPYGTDALLRFQLRMKLKAIKEDDQRILWEGVENLTRQELQDACRERGM